VLGRVLLDELTEADLPTVTQRGADLADEPLLVDVVDGEEGGGLGRLVSRLDGAVDLGLGRRRVERPLEGEGDLGAGRVELHHQGGARLTHVAQRHRAALDAAEQLDDAAVLQPDGVVEEPAQLVRQGADRGLGAVGREEPVAVDASDPVVGDDRLEVVDLVEQVAELVLPLGREQEVVERLEAAALV